ncbi:Pheromone-regulated membrane protein 10 [Pleurostoma richardsiae]|uniref:Pheromone-regulated membrane protein 10 n=1 Tax=Pleurostoma richardsiae TaxID=41990 RepID=A0AA38VHR4_9PEZI|nr:Pheromone-regulated membrane protein 10 [Pleurostoma richardsiae]
MCHFIIQPLTFPHSSRNAAVILLDAWRRYPGLHPPLQDMSSSRGDGEDSSSNQPPDGVPANGGKGKEKKRVGFLSDRQPPASSDDYFSFVADGGGNSSGGTPGALETPGDRDSFNRAELTSALEKILKPEHHAGPIPLTFPRPALRKQTAPESPAAQVPDQPLRSEIEARHRADRLAVAVGSGLASRNSLDMEDSPSVTSFAGDQALLGDDTSTEALVQPHGPSAAETQSGLRFRRRAQEAASELVRTHTVKKSDSSIPILGNFEGGPARSGTATPVAHDLEYVPRPTKYRGGILGSLLKLYGQDTPSGETSASAPGTPTRTPNRTPRGSPPTSMPGSPRAERPRSGLFALRAHHSASTLAELIGSSSTLAAPVSSRDISDAVSEKFKHERRYRRPKNNIDKYKIKNHIAEILSIHRYLVKLCRALMLYGAPTHRLEAYMGMSARVLGIEGQFLYLPGCMIISFDDSRTHTTEVKIVRSPQGVDLGRLRDVHEIYKQVVHDLISVDVAMERLDAVMTRKDKFPNWFRVLVYGFASAAVAPFAFEGRFIDLPIAFLLGCILGGLQLILAPSNELYANVFEITAAVITSFLARAFGSLRGGELFCFSALAQSSIALILPGYIVLCASLELQSHSMVSGSVRMVYAMIYSLFLGYGITIGSVLYGYIDQNATSKVHCDDPLDSKWYLLFVPLFTMCLCIVNQAKWKQTPIMLFISFAGFCVNSYSSRFFKGNTQVSNTLGALTIGFLANLYARLGRHVENFCLDMWEFYIEPRVRRLRFRKTPKSEYPLGPYPSQTIDPERGSVADSAKTAVAAPLSRQVGYGLAAAAMLPAIFVQVPSGLAAGGSLLSGVQSADQITHNKTATSSTTSEVTGLNTTAFNVLFSVIQVAISISVGLALSALIVYPFGKRRSGLFSF